MSVDPLLDSLATALAAAPVGPLSVGYSGGLDSSVLLHAFAQLPEARARGLRALHVDHGLHADSPRWAAHCTAVCAALDVPLQVLQVEVRDVETLGLEAAARQARYAAFASQQASGGVLALAQHRDDQAETLLLRLLHGAGHEGLAGMRILRPFARGWLWRPLLGQARAELERYAARHALQWLEDPANRDPRHARNHLRHAVLPALAARWPDAAARIAAAAARLRDEAEVLDDVAAKALAQAQGVDPATLAIASLRSQPPALRRTVLGRWLDQLGLPRPPPGLWQRLEPDLLDARVDATPLLAWRGAELRRYRDLLFAMAPLPPLDTDWSHRWDGTEPLVLPAGFGRLALDPPQPIEPMTVAPRRGGERLRQPGVRRELRTLLQDLGVPPWTRDRLPLLHAPDGELLAAGDLALAPDFAARLRAAGSRLRWSPPD
jgi:tRNA(Ile)-lysidine synthase